MKWILAGALVTAVLAMAAPPVHPDTVAIETASVDVPVHEHDPARGDTHYDHMLWAKGTTKAPRDLWITGFSVSVEGAPSGIVHNLYVAHEGESDAWCPENPKILWAAGSVTMLHGKEFASPYGIRVRKDTPLSVIALIHNGTEYGDGKEYKGVRITVRMTIEPPHNTTRSIPLTFHTITPGDCTITRPIFSLPSGARDITLSSRAHPFTFPSGGHILSAGAHFHGAYAVGARSRITLFLNDSLADSFEMDDPFKGEHRNPQLLKERVPLAVQKGDTLFLKASFDNPLPYPVEEGMALVSFYFAPEPTTP